MQIQPILGYFWATFGLYQPPTPPPFGSRPPLFTYPGSAPGINHIQTNTNKPSIGPCSSDSLEFIFRKCFNFNCYALKSVKTFMLHTTVHQVVTMFTSYSSKLFPCTCEKMVVTMVTTCHTQSESHFFTKTICHTH